MNEITCLNLIKFSHLKAMRKGRIDLGRLGLQSLVLKEHLEPC